MLIQKELEKLTQFFVFLVWLKSVLFCPKPGIWVFYFDTNVAK